MFEFIDLTALFSAPTEVNAKNCTGGSRESRDGKEDHTTPLPLLPLVHCIFDPRPRQPRGWPFSNDSTMKLLLIVTAAIELGAGLTLLVLPSAMVWFLVGSTVDAPAAQTVARVGGAALIVLGIACYIASGDAISRAAWGLGVAMLFYNVAVVAILQYAYFAIGMRGAALWLAVFLHAAMAAWCIVSLVSNPMQYLGNSQSIERAKP